MLENILNGLLDKQEEVKNILADNALYCFPCQSAHPFPSYHTHLLNVNYMNKDAAEVLKTDEAHYRL